MKPETMRVMSAAEAREAACVHSLRARAHTDAVRRRKDRGEPHPVMDFLFQYYPFPLSTLELWHPGLGVAVGWPDDAELKPPFSAKLHTRENGMVFADPGKLSEKELARLRWMRELLEATRDRAPNFSCHGLHEWAMVYGGHEIRHGKTLPLRLSQAEIDEVVRSRPVRCSHHDAFRFFAPAAREFNLLRPSLDTRQSFEQPACLHANMDLYKWAAKALPWVDASLLLDCFELAADTRDLDMRASPYDLTEWGRPPVRIEAPEGRRAYEREQRGLASRAAVLRARLIVALAGIEG